MALFNEAKALQFSSFNCISAYYFRHRAKGIHNKRFCDSRKHWYRDTLVHYRNNDGGNISDSCQVMINEKQRKPPWCSG